MLFRFYVQDFWNDPLNGGSWAENWRLDCNLNFTLLMKKAISKLFQFFLMRQSISQQTYQDHHKLLLH